MLPGFWDWDHLHSQSQSHSGISAFSGDSVRRGAIGCTCGSSRVCQKITLKRSIHADASVRRRVCGNRACAPARPSGQILTAVAVCGRMGEQTRGGVRAWAARRTWAHLPLRIAIGHGARARGKKEFGRFSYFSISLIDIVRRSPTDRSRAINAAIAASPITSSVVHMTRARAVCHAHDNERGTVPHPLCHPNPSQAAPLLSSCRHSSSSKRTSALISVAGTRYPFSTALTDNPRLTRRRADLAPSPVTTAWHGTEVPPPSGVSQLLSLAGAPCMLGLHAC